MSGIELFVAGAGALLTPGLAFPAAAAAWAGFTLGPRRGPWQHLVVGVVLVAVVALGLARRGLQPMSTTGAIVLSLLALMLVDLGRRHEEGLLRGTLLWGLLLGLGLILLRAPVYGPVLVATIGPWQTGASFASLAIYHAGSGLVLAVVYGIAALLGRRIAGHPTWGWAALVSAALVAVLALSGLLESLQTQLLLRWPVVTLG